MLSTIETIEQFSSTHHNPLGNTMPMSLDHHRFHCLNSTIITFLLLVHLSYCLRSSACLSSSSSSSSSTPAASPTSIRSKLFSSHDSTSTDNNNIVNNFPNTMAENRNTNSGGGSVGGIAARLARKNILELQPYRCARDDYSEGVLLDANENAFGPTSLPTNSLAPYNNSNLLERYPDPYQITLKELYAHYRGHNLTPSNIFVGVGSDEAIDLLMRIFCQPGGQDNILITPPTYGMYKVCAKVNDIPVLVAPLTPDFDLDIPKVRVVVEKHTPKCVYLLSPHVTTDWMGPFWDRWGGGGGGGKGWKMDNMSLNRFTDVLLCFFLGWIIFCLGWSTQSPALRCWKLLLPTLNSCLFVVQEIQPVRQYH
jgi:hypothetical protein